MTDRADFSTPTPNRIIALTGGVGMGKTTISNYLSTVHQLPVLDADLLAREAVKPGSSVLETIVERYGHAILLPDGQLDRLRLGEFIFNNPAERLWLEQRIHPYVRDRFQTELQSSLHTSPIVILVVPLLFEARMTDLATEIWVVYCPPQQQIERLMQREVQDGVYLNLDQINARIKSQMAIEKKLQQATIILDNSSTVEELLRQVDAALSTPPKAAA
ncbi:MAG: dephospho-CoA kinase [Leptolyngbyaceae cyanobacterium SL_7_1]|nr:dephospho-CoA kinase [Leptolyngbyaceae cyanobacterium SL_7_1]